jgi:hypothetical protein
VGTELVTKSVPPMVMIYTGDWGLDRRRTGKNRGLYLYGLENIGANT